MGRTGWRDEEPICQPSGRSGRRMLHVPLLRSTEVSDSFEQRLLRLRSRVEELERWRERARCDLTGWLFEGEPIALGGRWPRSDGVGRLTHPPVRVPEGWPLAATRLEIAPGGESLLRIDYGDTSQAFGVDPWHQRFPLKRREFRIELEAEALLPFGRRNPDPRLEAARLSLADLELERLLRRLRLVAAAGIALVGDVAVALVAAAERALECLAWPTETDAYLCPGSCATRGPSRSPSSSTVDDPHSLAQPARDSIRAARGVLEDELARQRALHPPPGRLALVGHGHVDLAWLWPLEVTQRKVQRTFHTAAGLLERYPEMTFTQSSAELYELAREVDPALFARVRELAAGGCWEPVGGMWVEPDMNMTAGESIVRQLLFGQHWFERELGRRHRVAWLPDCFGFSPGLPQLLLGAGIDAFFTTKLTWSETNRFPYDLYWWEGLDGSRVLAHSFDNDAASASEALGGYNGDPSPEALLSVWSNFRGRVAHTESLFTIGYGDGGGGPSADMMEDVRELEGFPALPEAAFSRVDAFFRRLRQSADAASLPVWVGELYLELHRGTLTTQGRTKRLHRRAERDLVAAEVAGSLAELLGTSRPDVDLGRAWRLLLRNQFHDILPGSSIGEVYVRADEELSAVIEAAGRATGDALERVAAAIAPPGDRPAALVVNPDLAARPLRLVLSEPLPGAQAVAGGWAFTDPTPVAGLEGVVLIGADEPAAGVLAEGRCLENAFLRVELAADGRLASVFDRRAGREVLDGQGNQLWVYVDKPRNWDAWDVDADYARQGEPLGRPEAIEITERGPHRAAIRLRWRHRASTITQSVRLWRNSPRLEFATELDWHDRRLLLKARFPLAVRSASATFETAFGVVERPTHRNTSWDQARFEVAGHRFADLSEPGYGLALLNDGRYGYHALGSELGISLLRSPVSPDPRADEGRHELTYALLPHSGRWLEGGVLTEAEDLNRPLLQVACRAGGPLRRQPLAVEGVPLGLGALKPAEDGDGLVLRLYEPQGARGSVRVALPEGWRVSDELNLLED
ncbi:MAG TPA: glycoside hydrolase family 38 C-terminal domain-containing protein, partial [Candidatus Dormibacteraeota bacterium]|nr:glycoside hydrolase family 38 C-terminal domain-containing protein [Candidatus Dormibacteraeota bacterium]